MSQRDGAVNRPGETTMDMSPNSVTRASGDHRMVRTQGAESLASKAAGAGFSVLCGEVATRACGASAGLYV